MVNSETKRKSYNKWRQSHLEEAQKADRERQKERYHSDETFRELKKQKNRERIVKRNQAIIEAGGELKPRGRPRKVQSTVPNIEEAFLMEPKPPGKRGRPKKQPGEPTHKYTKKKGVEHEPVEKDKVVDIVVPRRVRRYSI
jgi:hypothetical protein